MTGKFHRMTNILAESQISKKNIIPLRLMYEQKINEMHDFLTHTIKVDLFLRAYRHLP